MQILVTALLFFATVGAVSAESRQMVWKVDGVERRAIVFAPATTGPAPLVFVFHGAGDTADNFSGVGFQDAWPQALVVYMDGLGRAPGQGGAFVTADPSDRNRDLKFFDTAFASLRQQFRVDTTRVYATGFSNGAKLVYLLWATRAKTFAAFAPVAGMLTAKTSLAEPKPLLHIGGRQDHQNEFSEQLESVELGRTINGAGGKGATCGANCTLYASTKGAPVMTVLHPGGHVYPDDTTALIVKFFRAHP
jgi:polyhydroxybutyrate depolymerase